MDPMGFGLTGFWDFFQDIQGHKAIVGTEICVKFSGGHTVDGEDKSDAK